MMPLCRNPAMQVAVRQRASAPQDHPLALLSTAMDESSMRVAGGLAVSIMPE